ncbi:hypothetical protein SCUP234_08443 [Seiridium cupressi]
MSSRVHEFFHHRPFIVDNTTGYIASRGIKKDYPHCRIGVTNSFKSTFQDHSAEVEAAWKDYLVEYLMSNMTSRYPRFYEVQERLDFILHEENTPDYMHFSQNFYKAHANWDQLDHVCGFIIRLQKLRMDCEDKGEYADSWTKSTFWGSAYLLWELLHYFHCQEQDEEIKKGGTLGDAIKEQRDTSMPQFAAPPPSQTAQLKCPRYHLPRLW